MTTLHVLGTGCAKCRQLADLADAAARRAGRPYELVKVTDLGAIAGFGVMMTPALVVDGRVVVSGRLPTAAELDGWLR